MLTLVFSLLLCGSAQAIELVFKWHGLVVSAVSVGQAQSGAIHAKNGELKAREISLFNIFRQQQKTYEAYDFYALLDLIYGQRWRQAKRMSFLASDGYNQFVGIEALLKASGGKQGFLAYQEKGLAGFATIEKDRKRVDAGHFYLVWGGYAEGHKGSHADTLKWPYQLSSINVE